MTIERLPTLLTSFKDLAVPRTNVPIVFKPKLANKCEMIVPPCGFSTPKRVYEEYTSDEEEEEMTQVDTEDTKAVLAALLGAKEN